ncbi:MAG: phosphoribosyltransferase [Betaproteobacteria bacterium]|nr:phosphoribosyltransferase [Betaproteobacteria bacterium]
MSSHLHVSWDQYNVAIERLAAGLRDSGWKFNQIICIARGGMRVGDVLSRLFNVPLAIIATRSYTGEAGTERGEITVARHISMTTDALGDQVLLVDDLVDSGITLDVVRRHLLGDYPEIKTVRTAAIWYKACSNVVPDYYASYLPESPWIHQPFEKYDTMSPDDIG